MPNRCRIDMRRAVGSWRPVLLVAAVCGVLLLAGCAKAPGLWTYEDGQSAQGGGKAFSATAYARSVWHSKVLPTAERKAVPATTLLPAISANAAKAGAKYGHQASSGGSYAFLMKGTGTVTAYDASDQTGPLTVQVDGVAKNGTIRIGTGPVFVGTALRDSMPFIQFGDFTNQVDYANVSTALNALVRKNVIGNLDRKALIGKRVKFIGAFAPLPGAPLVLIPTLLKASP